MQTKSVLFDLDGVLVDSHAAWLELTRATIRALGDGRALSLEEFLPTIGTSMEADIARWFPTRTADEVSAYYATHFFDHAEHVRVNDGAHELLAWLAANRLRTAVVTNAPGTLARRLVPMLGLSIETVLSGTDVANGKPAPDMVFRALELIGVDAHDAVMVGDTDNDRLAARAAGVRFIGFRIDGDERIEHLADLQDLLVFAR